MIKSEFLNDGALIRHYSDAGMKIRQLETDIIYDEAVDVVPCRYTYEETDEPIPVDPIDEQADLAEAGRILLGAEE